MRNLESVVHVSLHESPCTYRSCLMHQSIRHWSVRIGNPVRSSRVVKCDGNETVGRMWAKKHEIEDKHPKVIEPFGLHDVLNLPRHNEGEILPKFIEPLGLQDVLQDRAPRGESLGARLCNFADSLVTSCLTPSELKPPLDPSVVLSGVFGPVCETEPTECRITYGRIPEDLEGVYLRNGPNPALLHRGDGIHAFDGDGMIHAVRMRNGSASYCSRFVKTSRFRQERAAGRPLLPKIFGGMYGLSGAARVLISGLRVALGLLDVSHGVGLSNTNVAFFNGHILSLSQEDMPYILRVTDDGDVITLRQFKLPSRFTMCAHPKFDPVSGDMYAHSLQISFPIHYSLFRVPAASEDDDDDDDDDDDGNVCCVPLLEVPVPALNIPMAHDFAITQRFIIFPDDQIVFRLAHLTMGETPLGYDANKTGRFCLLPRDSDSKPQWFEAPGINCFHYLNAWEEGSDDDEVVLLATEVSPADRIHEFPHTITFVLSEIRFDTRKGVVTRREICAGMDLEFGVFNRKYTGRKTRYAYYGIWCDRVFKGVVKLDLMQEGGSSGQEFLVAKREFGEGKFVGEPCFVEARGAKSEDHGYLLCLVGDKQGGVSELWILDALSPTLEVIAIVELPAHVPPGFHGCFVNEEQLAQQKP